MTSAVVPTRTFEEVQQQQRRSDPAGDRPLPGFRSAACTVPLSTFAQLAEADAE